MTSFPRSEHIPKADIRLPPIYTHNLIIQNSSIKSEKSILSNSLKSTSSNFQSTSSSAGGLKFATSPKKPFQRKRKNFSIQSNEKDLNDNNFTSSENLNQIKNIVEEPIKIPKLQGNEFDTWESLGFKKKNGTSEKSDTSPQRSAKLNQLNNTLSQFKDYFLSTRVSNEDLENNEKEVRNVSRSSTYYISNPNANFNQDLTAIKRKQELQQLFPSPENTFLYSIQSINEFPLPESKIPKEYYATQDLEKLGKKIASSKVEQQKLLDQMLLATYSEYKTKKESDLQEESTNYPTIQPDYIDSSDISSKQLLFPTANPTKRLEVFLLAKAIDDMLEIVSNKNQIETNEKESKHRKLISFLHAMHEIHLIALREVTRQVYITCTERGIILMMLEKFFSKFFEIAMEIIQQERKKSSDLRELIREYENLTNDLAVEKQQQANEMERLLRDQTNLFKEREVLRRKILTGSNINPKYDLIVNLLKNSQTRNKVLKSIQNELNVDEIQFSSESDDDELLRIDDNDEYFRKFEEKRNKATIDEVKQNEKVKKENTLKMVKKEIVDTIDKFIPVVQSIASYSWKDAEEKANDIQETISTLENNDFSMENVAMLIKDLTTLITSMKNKLNEDEYISVFLHKTTPNDEANGKFIRVEFKNKQLKAAKDASEITELYQTISELRREFRQEHEARAEADRQVEELKQELNFYLENLVKSDSARQRLNNRAKEFKSDSSLSDNDSIFLKLHNITDRKKRIKLLQDSIDTEREKLNVLENILANEQSATQQIEKPIILGPYSDPHEAYHLVSNSSQKEKDMKPMDQFMVDGVV